MSANVQHPFACWLMLLQEELCVLTFAAARSA